MHTQFQDDNRERVTKQQRDGEEISSREVGRGFINHQPGDWGASQVAQLSKQQL